MLATLAVLPAVACCVMSSTASFVVHQLRPAAQWGILSS